GQGLLERGAAIHHRFDLRSSQGTTSTGWPPGVARGRLSDPSLPRRDTKCVRDVADRLDAALVVHDHGDDVEAARHLPHALGLEVAVRELPQAVLLAGAHAGLGRITLQVLARLHLDEDESLAFLGDEIDLARPGADILVQDGV